jgi:two-component system nitrogen regulation response regulator GlnG
MLENDRRLSLKEIVQRNTLALERTVLTQTLNQTGGNKAQAARLLQIDYKTMHTKIKKLGISAKGEPT